jgi:hypothetical protein
MEQKQRVVLFILAGLLLTGIARAQAPLATGQIAGVVAGDDGKPLAGVFVSYVHAPPIDPADPTPGSGGILSVSNGKFAFARLTAGTYLFCARAVPSRQLVEFCEWTLNPPSVRLISGQTVGGVQLLLSKGARLELQVDDPKSLLPDPEEPRPGTEFHIGVRTAEGLFHEARLTSRDNGGKLWFLIVPFNVALRLDARALNVDVSDDKGGKPAKNGPGIAFQIDPKTPVQKLKFSVDVEKKN